MKEFKLQVNYQYYLALSILATVILSGSWLTKVVGFTYVSSFTATIALLILMYSAVGLLLSVSGQCRATICNQGIAYCSLVKRRQYIPFEQVITVRVEKRYGLITTKIVTAEKSFRLWSFMPSKTQRNNLRVLGYPQPSL